MCYLYKNIYSIFLTSLFLFLIVWISIAFLTSLRSFHKTGSATILDFYILGQYLIGQYLGRLRSNRPPDWYYTFIFTSWLRYRYQSLSSNRGVWLITISLLAEKHLAKFIFSTMGNEGEVILIQNSVSNDRRIRWIGHTKM